MAATTQQQQQQVVLVVLVLLSAPWQVAEWQWPTKTIH